MALFNNEDGPDTITAPDESSVIQEGSKTFYSLGTNDNDVITGGSGSDLIVVTPGTDALDGGEGLSDQFSAGGYVYMQAGLEGENGARYTAVASDLVLDLDAGTYTVNWREDSATGLLIIASSGTLTGIEQIYDTLGDDRILGHDAPVVFPNGFEVPERLYISGGTDFVDGRGGIDTLIIIRSDSKFDGVIVDVAAGTIRDTGGNIDTFRNIERFELTNGADVFIGDDTDNWVGGAGGGDTLTGGKGFDVLDYFNLGTSPGGIKVTAGKHKVSGDNFTETYTGFEQIRGTYYDDVMKGGKGKDNFVGNDGNDSLGGGNGDDTLDGSNGNDMLLGGKGDDILDGGNDDDSLNGGKHNDEMTGGRGVDFVDGGKGRDTLNFMLGSQSLLLGVNVDMAAGTMVDQWGNAETFKNIENVTGTDQIDIIRGDDGRNVIMGNDGRDILAGRGGNDKLIGGKNRDNLVGGDGNDTLFGQKGNDGLNGGQGVDRLYGGAGNDKLFDDFVEKWPKETKYLARDVRDWLLLGGKVAELGASDFEPYNLLDGGSGDDQLRGFGALFGGDDDDIIEGTGLLVGGDGNDIIYQNELYENALSTHFAVLSGGLGNDTLGTVSSGDSYTVTVTYDYSDVRVKVDLRSGTAFLRAGDRDTLINVSTVFGTDFDDVFEDSAGNSSKFYGGNGNDTINLRSNAVDKSDASWTDGGDGDDVIKGIGGFLGLNGGAGEDKILMRGTTSNVTGGADNDTITVDARGDGAHEISGNGGDDKFLIIRSGNFSTRVEIDGGAGNDLFIFKNRDKNPNWQIDGGNGSDTFRFAAANQKVYVGDATAQDRFEIGRFFTKENNTFSKLKATATESDQGVVIDLKGDAELILHGLGIDDLRANMFDF